MSAAAVVVAVAVAAVIAVAIAAVAAVAAAAEDFSITVDQSTRTLRDCVNQQQQNIYQRREHIFHIAADREHLGQLMLPAPPLRAFVSFPCWRRFFCSL